MWNVFEGVVDLLCECLIPNHCVALKVYIQAFKMVVGFPTHAPTPTVSPQSSPSDSHTHVLPAWDRLPEGLRLHPIKAGPQLSGEDHIQEEAPWAHHLQVWEQQHSRRGDPGSGEVMASVWNASFFFFSQPIKVEGLQNTRIEYMFVNIPKLTLVDMQCPQKVSTSWDACLI